MSKGSARGLTGKERAEATRESVRVPKGEREEEEEEEEVIHSVDFFF